MQRINKCKGGWCANLTYRRKVKSYRHTVFQDENSLQDLYSTWVKWMPCLLSDQKNRNHWCSPVTLTLSGWTGDDLIVISEAEFCSVLELKSIVKGVSNIFVHPCAICKCDLRNVENTFQYIAAQFNTTPQTTTFQLTKVLSQHVDSWDRENKTGPFK